MTPTIDIPTKSTDTSKWFDNLIASIRSEEIQLVCGIATQEKKDFWKPFFEDNHLEIAKRSRESASILLIPNLLADYVNGIKRRKIDLVSLSFQLSDSIILVWAVVNDDDELSMDNLFLQEAEVNAKYCDHGFHISTTIMEKSDNCPTPSHFQQFI